MIKSEVNVDTTLVLIDTPGFDDTIRSDDEILKEIAVFLEAQRQLNVHLKGIIYLHRITDERMQGSALKYLQVFRELCGIAAFRNVIFLTTMWHKQMDKEVGYERMQELRKKFLASMEKKNCYVAKFDGSAEMARGLVKRLLGMDDIELKIQKELAQGLRLDETSAGRLIAPGLDDQLRKDEQERERLDRAVAEARQLHDSLCLERLAQEVEVAKRKFNENSDKRDRFRARVKEEAEEDIKRQRGFFRSKGALTILAAILGIIPSLIFNILPFFGI